MSEAILWGAIAASTLLLGALIAFVANPGRTVIAVVMAVGSGLLLGAVAYELIDDALESQSLWAVSAALLLGAVVFAIGDWIIDRRGGEQRKDPAGGQETGSPLAIVLGSVLDGIPESFVLGLTVLQGGVSVGLLVAIGLSNLPEGMSSSRGLTAAGWPRRRVALMWLAVIAVSAVSAGLGYVLLDPEGDRNGALAQAFAGGALLAMLADTMLPESYEVEGVLTGLLVAAGFALAIGLNTL
jgi:ZIP family zinc transporter